MMFDVVIALAPALAVGVWVFGIRVVAHALVCVAISLVTEAILTKARGRRPTLADGSATVTGLLVALSLPATSPWHVDVIACAVAVGIGKMAFGGLGQNIFNPAMVGRAFVMISFPAALGAGAYVSTLGADAVDAITGATPLTAAKQLGQATPLDRLVIGAHNGSMGETSSAALFVGGLLLCLRGTAAWEIPVGMIGAYAALAGARQTFAAGPPGWTMAHELLAGSLLFGAFFIATDPVTSPLTPKGKLLFGAGVGALTWLLRVFSGYPEGVMFAVLLMNATVPLINRWTIPRPVGGFPRNSRPA
jgi:electron transport complex protein RnfD